MLIARFRLATTAPPITKHDIWNTRIGAFDRQIPAGRADVGRFTFNIPNDARGPIKLLARLITAVSTVVS